MAMGGQAERAGAVSGPEDHDNKIGIPDLISAVRAELARAVEENADEDIQFPVNGVDLEFQVGITRSAEATAGIRLWVIDVGGKGGYESQSAHTVTVSLGAPVNRQGETIKVTRSASYKP